MDDLVRKGDYIVLHHGEKDHHFLKYMGKSSFGTRIGQIPLPEELYFGETLESSSGTLFHVLRPTVAELSMRVKRATTISYPKDVGWMLLHSDLRAGSRVLECGSGSGALTSILAGIVGDEGKVYSVERREDHFERARENVERYGLTSRVEFFLRDAEIEGFPVTGITTCFIDVPEPWSLVPAAKEALAGGGFWLSLSPTFNQVERVVMALEESKFTDITTVEILERRMLVREGKTRPSERNITHTAFLTRASRTGTASDGCDPDQPIQQPPETEDSQ